MRISSKLAKILVLAVLPLGGAGVALAVTHARDGLPDGAAFQIGGTVVTTAELDRQAGLLEALYGIKKPADDQGAYQRDIAKAVAVGMVLDRAAADEGIVVPDKAARDTLATMVDKQLGGTDGQREFTALLGQYGVTEDDVLAEIKRQQNIARLFQNVSTPAVTGVTDADAQQLFETDPARFATPEQRQLRNIVVATRQEASQLRALLTRGADFASLARQHSLDDATRAHGGSLGWVSAEQLDPAYAAVAFAAGAHGVVGPVQTQYGWNIGQVVAIRPSVRPAFADVKTDVLDALRSERAMAAWRAWIIAQIRDAHIEYAPDYRPADPDAPPPGLGEPTADIAP